VDTGAEGPQQAVATIALLHHGGRHRNGYQGLGRRLEDSSPHPRHTCKDNGGGGRKEETQPQEVPVPKKPRTGQTKTKQMKEGTTKTGTQKGKKNNTQFGPSTTETGRGSAGDYTKSQSTRTRPD
jgi:hypothetical protein